MIYSKNTLTLFLGVCLWVVLPFYSQTTHIELAKKDLITTHLYRITGTKKSRNYKNIEALNEVASYIHSELSKYCDTVYYQPYKVRGKIYKNVIGSIKGQSSKDRLVIGAHYDVAGNQQGADDNASGVTGVLELARLLSHDTLANQIDFVAYTLEEPPFFRTKKMGSYQHAKSLFDKDIDIKGMICLEMIGYFSEEDYSQIYPTKDLLHRYGNKGNFISLVGEVSDIEFMPMFSKAFQKHQRIKTHAIKGAKDIPGIDFSDHMNYWHFGYNAVMITDTAMFRNIHYHTTSDTVETINIPKMKSVIDQLYLAIQSSMLCTTE